MKRSYRFFRLIHISYVLLKHGLDEIVFETHLFRGLRFLVIFSPFRYTERRQKPRAIRIREALEELGPIFVKFGQVLSTRPDIIPEDIIKELRLLQDQVPPFSGELASSMIEKALEQPLDRVFQRFDSEALASASVAQVHAATLLDGNLVVVKVLRPHVRQRIEGDIALLKTIANLAHRYSKRAKQFKPREVVHEFEKSLLFELDLMREGANASQLRRNFTNSRLLYVPKIYWEFSKNNILVMERIYGIPIHQVNFLKLQGYHLKRLAEVCIEIFFTQVFRDCFFHADMHPGNLLVSKTSAENPSLIAIDFGIMGSLDPEDQRYLAENFLAFFKRDYRRVAELHLKSGWIPPHTRLDEFEASIRTVCEPMFERPMKEISIGQLLLRLFQTASQFEIIIQPQLILLQKTLLNIEGLARELYPDLDLWQTARPHLEKWMKTQVGPRAFLRKLKNDSPYYFEKLPELPDLLYRVLSKQLNEGSDYYDAAHDKHRQYHKMGEARTLRTRYSFYNICFAFLLGFSLSIAVLFVRSYF
jgi:ubiquinone biosynthesis protein